MTIAYSGDSITYPDNSVQNTAPKVGMVNRIINGAMVIDQRNAGASVTFNDGVFAVDRFRCNANISNKCSAQRSTVAPTDFVNSLLVTSTSAYSVGAGEIMSFYQGVEGLNVSDLGWGTANAQTVTLSFWVRSSLTGTFGGALKNSASNRSYPFSYTISAANTFEYKTITIAGDTSGTWLTTNGVGIYLQFGLGVGSTFSGPAGAWAAANLISATGATSVVGTSGATFYITGVQLEKGSTATSFDYRPYGTELQLCQRYYVIKNCVVTTSSIYQSIHLPVQMRTYPTIPVTAFESGTGATFSSASTASVAVAPSFVYQSANHSTTAIASLAVSAEL